MGEEELAYAEYPRGKKIASGTAASEDLLVAANAFSWLNMAALAWVLLIAASIFVGNYGPAWCLIISLSLVQLVPTVLAALAAWQPRRALGISLAWIIGFSLFSVAIPLGFMLMAASLTESFTRFFRREGIRMGMFGPNQRALLETVRGKGYAPPLNAFSAPPEP